MIEQRELKGLLIVAARLRVEEVKGKDGSFKAAVVFGYMQGLLMAAGLVDNIDFSDKERVEMFLNDNPDLVEFLYGESYENREKYLNELREKYNVT